MSVKVLTRSKKPWEKHEEGEFECRYELADLEKGRTLTSEKFDWLGSTWYFNVKRSKEPFPFTLFRSPGVVQRFTVWLRCLSKEEGIRDFDSCEVAMGDSCQVMMGLRPYGLDLQRGLWLFSHVVKVAERAEEGTVLFHLTIEALNTARLFPIKPSNTNLRFRKEATNMGKGEPVDERETGGRLEGDTGRAEGPTPKSETGGMKGDTGKAERPPPKSETGARPPRGQGADRSITGEFGWLFAYCAFMCHRLGVSFAYFILASLGLWCFRKRVSGVLQEAKWLTYLCASCCAIIPLFFRSYGGHTVQANLLFGIAIIVWNLCVKIWKSTTTLVKGIQGTPDGRQ